MSLHLDPNQTLLHFITSRYQQRNCLIIFTHLVSNKILLFLDTSHVRFISSYLYDKHFLWNISLNSVL